MAAATEQAALRRRAAAKFSRADRMLFTAAGLEQASSETVARHRAQRFRTAGDRVLDLCCGIGGDLVALANAVPDAVGVDRDERHALAARHNVECYDGATAMVVADVTRLRVPRDVGVFVDPARRSGGSRARSSDRGADHSPPLDWCLRLAADRVCIKTAPGLDHSVVPQGWEAEFVAVGRDLKEAVLWSPAWSTATTRATVLRDGCVDTMTADPQLPAPPVRPPGAFLLDPSPAVTRAGAVADLAAAVGAWQVDPRIAFLSADAALRTPFGTGYAIEASLPFGVKPVAGELRRLDIGDVTIRRRGLAGDVDTLRRRWRGAGSRTATVMLTRVGGRPWALVCRQLPAV